jgi:hypothetical protein
LPGALAGVAFGRCGDGPAGKMAVQETRQSWWHTLPGFLTGLAGTITAVTGLLVVLEKSGAFRSSPEKVSDTNVEISPQRRTAPVKRTHRPAPIPEPKSARSQEPAAAGGNRVALEASPDAAPAAVSAAEPVGSQGERADASAQVAATDASAPATSAPADIVAPKAATTEAAKESPQPDARAEKETPAPAASGPLDAVAGSWRGVAEDETGRKAPASAEVQADGSFSVESALTGRQEGTVIAAGSTLRFETPSHGTGTLELEKKAEGKDVLTWQGLPPASPPSPPSEPEQQAPPKTSISLRLERAK